MVPERGSNSIAPQYFLATDLKTPYRNTLIKTPLRHPRPQASPQTFPPLCHFIQSHPLPTTIRGHLARQALRFLSGQAGIKLQNRGALFVGFRHRQQTVLESLSLIHPEDLNSTPTIIKTCGIFGDFGDPFSHNRKRAPSSGEILGTLGDFFSRKRFCVFHLSLLAKIGHLSAPDSHSLFTGGHLNNVCATHIYLFIWHRALVLKISLSLLQQAANLLQLRKNLF